MKDPEIILCNHMGQTSIKTKADLFLNWNVNSTLQTQAFTPSRFYKSTSESPGKEIWPFALQPRRLRRGGAVCRSCTSPFYLCINLFMSSKAFWIKCDANHGNKSRYLGEQPVPAAFSPDTAPLPVPPAMPILALKQLALLPEHSFSYRNSLRHTQGWFLALKPVRALFASLYF